jgi:hypothetical protein
VVQSKRKAEHSRLLDKLGMEVLSAECGSGLTTETALVRTVSIG